MTRYTPPKAQKKRSRAWLPVIGFTLAVLLGIVSYIVAPVIVDFAREQNADIAVQFNEFEAENGENSLRILTAVLLWGLLLAVSFFIVAAAVGRDTEVASFRELPPSPADRKAHKRALQKELKQVERQRKRAKK